MKKIFYFLKDSETNQYIGFKFTSLNSNSIQFFTFKNRDDFYGFRYEETALRYILSYKEVTGRNAILVDESDTNDETNSS